MELTKLKFEYFNLPGQFVLAGLHILSESKLLYKFSGSNICFKLNSKKFVQKGIPPFLGK